MRKQHEKLKEKKNDTGPLVEESEKKNIEEQKIKIQDQILGKKKQKKKTEKLDEKN